MQDINKGTRLANYIVDFTAVCIVWFVFDMIVQTPYFMGFLFYPFMFFYYLILEAATGQTLGKMITKTKVVNMDGSKPKFYRILLRSFWRIIPLDNFTYLMGHGLGMHDSFSSTKLTKVPVVKPQVH